MRIHFKSMAIAVSLVCTQSISAGVTITGTRIIFPSNQNTVTVQLNNPGQQPALLQAWLDDGDANDIPEADKIPFILTPPLTKIEPYKGQMLRLISKGTQQLPKDRESLFWFNILDIPAYELASVTAENQTTDPNKLQVSIRSRIKLFYRPQQLKMSQEKAFNALTFEYSNTDHSLKISNPTPYFMSFLDLKLNPAQENISYTDTLMLAPFSSEQIEPSKKIIPTQVEYHLINDFGGVQRFKASIESSSK